MSQRLGCTLSLVRFGAGKLHRCWYPQCDPPSEGQEPNFTNSLFDDFLIDGKYTIRVSRLPSLTASPSRRLCSAVVAESSNGATAAVPAPVVKIDNQTDAFSTVVTVEFGDKLGELVDTVR